MFDTWLNILNVFLFNTQLLCYFFKDLFNFTRY